MNACTLSTSGDVVCNERILATNLIYDMLSTSLVKIKMASN